MKRLLILLPYLLCTCQTHRVRHTSQQDSSYLQSMKSATQLEKATTQSVHQDWQRWSAESTAVVILPKGPVSYHPSRGFEGEATAILSYGAQSQYTALRRDHANNQTEERSSASDYTSATQTHSKERESETDRQPVSGFSFRWLAIALMAGCLLFFVRRLYRQRDT